jgi:hypothetical protein
MRGALVDAEEARTVGRRVRQIRKARRKSLVVAAGLAGMSKSKLDRIERGEHALDKLSDIVALAGALQIAPSELMRLPVPAPSNGHTDSATDEVRLALTAVSRHQPGGQVVPVEALRDRVNLTMTAARNCRQVEVSTVLPGLVRDVHTTLAVGRDVAELLDLAVLLHVQLVGHWLREVGAPLDLRRENDVILVYRLAEQRDTPIALGLAAYGATRVLLATGAFELVGTDLAAVDVPTSTVESTQLAGMLALSHALVVGASSHPADVAAAVEHAAELAARTGEGTATGWGSARPTWACGAWKPCWRSAITSSP